MIKKYTKKIIFLLAIFLILITKVDAQYKSEVYSVHNENIGGLPNSNNPSSESGRKNGLPTYSTSGNCESTYKKVDYYHSASSRLNVDLKDMYGNDIVGDRLELKSLGYKFQAGTYIQMRITEEHRISIGAKITIIKTKWKWKCRDFEWDSCKTIKGYTQSGAPICVPGYVEVGSYQACVCPAPDRPGGIAGFWVSTTSEDWKVFANSINLEPYNLSQSYKIEYKDSNKAGLPITDDTNYNDYLTSDIINGNECDNVYDTKTEYPFEENQEPNNDGMLDEETGEITNTPSATKEATTTCKISYNRGRLCMNIKTGEVRYFPVGSMQECNEDEYTIDPVSEGDEKGMWKYFIPLDANSKTGFNLKLSSSSYKQIPSLCKDLVEKNFENDRYQKLILYDKDGTATPFEGRYTLEDAKSKVATGCYHQIVMEIPIEQKFYHELEDGKTLQGFNFYYKPIDINNPFPNGLSNTSAWYKWYESQKDSNINDLAPNLTESFDEITYYTTNFNDKEVREYNAGIEESKRYTNWSNMNLDGTSKYIDNEGVIYRNFQLEKDSFYKLGCGPQNTNVDISNAFYQKECNR